MVGVIVSMHPGLIDHEIEDGRTEVQIKKDVDERYKAMMLLLSADVKTYSGIWSDLEKSITLGSNKYPTTLTGAFEILAKCKNPSTNNNQLNNNNNNNIPPSTGATLAQVTQNDASHANNNNNAPPNPSNE